jgi:hypothetical protein
MEGGSVIIGEQNIVQDRLTDFNNHEDQDQFMKNSNRKILHQITNLNSLIHPSNNAQNTSIKNQKRSSQFLLIRILRTKVKAMSLATAISLKHL